MIVKKGLIFVGIVLGCMSCLFGNDESISSDKTNCLPATTQKVETKISGDIERPLLRPVVLKKEEAVSDLNNQKTEELSSDSKKEDGVENLLALLRTEREKLQELENKYNKIGNHGFVELDGAKNKNGDMDKITGSLPVAQENGLAQSGDIQDKIGMPKEISNRDAAKDVSIREGSSTAQLYIMKNNKKSEVCTNNTINQRLEMIIKNVSQLDVAECYYKLCEYDNALQMYKLFTPNNTSSDQYIWAQYQVANCYRNMKKYDSALSEYQRFVNQFPDSDLTDQAKWYMEDIGWWKAWSEKNTSANNQLLTASNNHVSK
ncbi:MAG: tetratricopeptide repeat protein [Candidatus Brocadiales bacterium]|nr:tetratricopeptide repeat protein [Candidatus Brocadiales bacterium]